MKAVPLGDKTKKTEKTEKNPQGFNPKWFKLIFLFSLAALKNVNTRLGDVNIWAMPHIHLFGTASHTIVR